MTQTTSTRLSEIQLSTEKEAIRRWADRHSAVPVRGTSDGTLALVHEYKIDDRHERLDWETFYD